MIGQVNGSVSNCTGEGCSTKIVKNHFVWGPRAGIIVFVFFNFLMDFESVSRQISTRRVQLDYLEEARNPLICEWVLKIEKIDAFRKHQQSSQICLK